MTDHIAQFREAMIAAGITPPDEIIADGRLHRFPTSSKPSDDSGWYVFHADRMPAGAFGCWRAGISETWSTRPERDMSPQERAEHHRRIEAIRRQREAEQECRQAQARERAATIFEAAQPAPADHPYLTRKGIQPHGVRVHKGTLVIPMRDIGGTLHSLEFIVEDGQKRFLRDGRTAGTYHAIGRPDGVIHIAEGYATGATVHETTGQAVAIAFTAGNLEAVARSIRGKFPEAQIIVAGDNDESGTGQEAARTAAEAVGGMMAIPPVPGDWNDFHQAEGATAVRVGIEAATESPEAIPESARSGPVDDDAEIARLATLSPFQYDRERKTAARRLGVQIGTLDDGVRRRRQAAQDNKERHAIEELFPDVPEYDGDVDGAELLSEIRGELLRYIVFPTDREPLTIALWVLHTYAVDVAYIAPILDIHSPQKRCGKSSLLKLLAAIVHRGLATENISAAALYRAMEMYRPTLLVDEFDAATDEDEDLRRIINAGHSRGSRTLRVGGINRDQVEAFDSFGPKAVSGIGKRRGTIADRSVTISLRRKLKGERVELLRLDRLDHSELQGRCAAWAEQETDSLRAADPAVPVTLHDRAADNWRPLLAIADLCGAGTEARKAAMALSEDADDETAAVMLLADIRTLFTGRGMDRLTSAVIVEALAEMEDRPWPEWKKGKPITQRQLARLLADFRIAPGNLKVDSKVVKGYRLEQFRDAFSRYLPDSGDPSATPLHCSPGAAIDDVGSATAADQVADRSATATGEVADRKSRKASSGADGSGVADRNAEIEGGGEYFAGWREI